jgi:hypothetical protein
MWLDDARGNLIDWTTQRWVQWSGRTVSLTDYPWLDGPAGTPRGIGTDFFDEYARHEGLRVLRGQPGGLIPDLEVLRSGTFNPAAVSPAVADFYAHTSTYELDAWSQWTGVFRPFGWALAVLFSRRLQQLNVPLSNLDTSRGMTSEVVPIVDGTTNLPVFTAWIRQLVGTGNVIYAGAYSSCVVPDDATPCVRIVFPLPNGNAMVLMRPVLHPDGSLTLVSAGRSFGSPGFYFTVRASDGRVWARYLRSLRESIHVYASEGTVRADHVLSLWGVTFLRLHYRLRERTSTHARNPHSPLGGATVPGGVSL